MKKAVFRKLYANSADVKKKTSKILALETNEDKKLEALETKLSKISRRKKGDE